MKYEYHPIANALPRMSSEGYAAFVANMRQYGYDARFPIVLFEGKILDGRHRYEAACELGLTPTFCEAGDGSNPWQIAITGELRRNYEDEGQRAGCLLPLVKESNAWLARQQAVLDEANARRSAAAEAQHAVSTPRRGETMDYGPPIESGRTKQRQGDHGRNRQKSEALAAAIGVNRGAIEKAQWVTAHAAPEVVDQWKNGSIRTADAIRETKRAEKIAELEAVAERECVMPTGLFDVVVIDPPWDMQKIEREERPRQSGMDYPTMTEDELRQLVIPCDTNCHVWLWTTHKFMPMALRLLNEWHLKYVCTFVWHKPGGFQPVGLPQYNCEFALYARRGAPEFIDTKALPTCFTAPRGAHSAKPEEFYAMVRRVTAGRRLDMFNRRTIDGFSGYGKEAAV